MTTLPVGITPRLLSREQAAEYCGCASLSAFADWQRRGIIPPSMAGTNRWDRDLIDLWLDKRSGLISDGALSAAEQWLIRHADRPAS